MMHAMVPQCSQFLSRSQLPLQSVDYDLIIFKLAIDILSLFQ